MRINATGLAYGHSVTDDNMRMNLRSVANDSSITDAGISPDIDILTNGGLRRDGGQRVNTLLARLHLFVKLKQLGYGLIGILHTNECGTDRMFQFQIFVHQNDARLGII